MNGGAVAYLTHSQYGRNGHEIMMSNNSNYITGVAADSVTANSTTSITYTYNQTKGMLASTTGNIYGVYDLSGGAWERTAGWDPESSDTKLLNNGKSIDGKEQFKKGGTSDKYKTAYSNGTSEYSGEKVKNICRIGDGIKEAWASSNRSWFNDFSRFPYSEYPFSERGGGHTNIEGTGMFYVYYTGGQSGAGGSFRVILAGGK